MNKKTFTLIEIMVSAVILALTFGALLLAFVAAKRYVSRVNKRLVSVNLGREVLNSLYDEVRPEWDERGELDVRIHEDEIDVTIDRRDYSGDYIVMEAEDADGDEIADFEYRRVKIHTNYPVE